jgi:hypothetical protein
MQGGLGQRQANYQWKPGFLPDTVNQLVRAALWRDQRIIGERYSSFTFLLWHESRSFDLLEPMVSFINEHISPNGELFGDSSTVPLLALETQRSIAGRQVDTNIQRYRSDAAARRALIETIDTPNTDLIILRDHFGVAGLSEIQQLINDKYRFLQAFKASEEGAIYRVFKRK